MTEATVPTVPIAPLEEHAWALEGWQSEAGYLGSNPDITADIVERHIAYETQSIEEIIPTTPEALADGEWATHAIEEHNNR